MKKGISKKGSLVTGGLLWRHPTLRYRVSGLSPEKLVKRIESALAELDAQAKAGRDNAKGEFERLMTALGSWYQSELRERAKAGDKSFHGSSSIQELLELADDTIECLGWLAKNRSADCEYYAERRMNWPGFVSILADIESKSQAIKACIPLGRKFEHYSRKRTQADILFRCARFAIDYFTDHPSFDSNAAFYFYPYINGVEWMERQVAHKAINDYCKTLGPVAQINWPKWKPVFARFITLQYGPSSERWKLIPDTPMPKKLFQKSEIKSKRPELVPKSWNDCLHIADRFGTTAEWYQEFGKKMPLTPAERIELLSDLKQMAAQSGRRCIMDIPPDASLRRLQKRANSRNGKWGDYKNEILRRCRNLLPPG
jgi:hypothetical protein